MNAPLFRDFARLHDSDAGGHFPGRLWSLWEMLKFNAAPFYKVNQLLWNFRTNVENSEGEAKKFFEKPIVSIVGGDSSINQFKENAVELKGILHILGVRVTELIADELIKDLQRNRYITPANIAKYYGEIDATLRRELSLVTLLSLSSDEQSLYESDRHFGNEFDVKFQNSGAFEVDEAVKALALGRSTASVFHLMRLMEIGIRAVTRCLGIPDPTKGADRNWGYIIKVMKAEIDVRNAAASGKPWSAPSDRGFFEEAYVSLDAVRIAWRNTTMHVEKKYTYEEAENILNAVKGFMKKLASRCDEEGLPLA